MTEQQKKSVKQYAKGLITGISISVICTVILGYIVIGQIMASNTAKIDYNKGRIESIDNEVQTKASVNMVNDLVIEYRGFLKEYKTDQKELTTSINDIKILLKNR